ncbi:hypothetical protein NW762_007357, partial [Fusarium torreyae]
MSESGQVTANVEEVPPTEETTVNPTFGNSRRSSRADEVEDADDEAVQSFVIGDTFTPSSRPSSPQQLRPSALGHFKYLWDPEAF